MSAAKRIHRRSDRKQKSADHATWSSSRETGIRGRKRPRLCTSTHPDGRPKTHLGKGQVRPPKRWKSIGISDAQADMLLAEASSAICVQRFDDSHTSCNSHYVSHFAAFFIVARAKISVVESYQCGSASARASSRAAYLASVCVVCLECVGVCEGAG